MLTADLKQNPDATLSTLGHSFATAKKTVGSQFKSIGIEDASDLATSVGYLLAGAYALAMVLNLATIY
jgi:hypothetical protein